MDALYSNSALFSLLKIVVVTLLFAMPIGSLMTLLGDRKQSAMVQNRMGPNRARLPFINLPLVGLPHFLADGLKMIFKEDVIPDGANRAWHNAAPILSLFPALVMWAVIPFSDLYCTGTIVVENLRDVCVGGEARNYFSIANIDAGILYIFAFSAVSVYGAAIAGWASNAKYSLLGGLRASAMMISYEVTMGLSIIGLLMIYGTMNLNDMVIWQGQLLWGWLPAWGIVVQPLSFFIFFIAMLAESKRCPFDLPESESELAAGYFTEFSSMKFASIQLSEYVVTVFIGSLVATLFLGGWQVPYLYGDGFHFGAGGVDIALPYGVVILLRITSIVIKTLVILWLQFMIRWTIPRFRYDQVMDLCWKILLPVSLANLAVTALVIALI